MMFGIGLGLSGVAGALLSMTYEISPSMGEPYTVTALIVITLGGFGSLAGSLADWKLVLQTTQISPAPLPVPGTHELVQYADGWDAFPAARRRLMEAIAQPRVRDVVFLGGDVHRHVAANLRLNPLDATSPIVASELVASSVTSRGLSEWLTSAIRRRQPDILHCRSDQRGYALLDLTPERLRCEFRATAHPVQADARFHVQARYEIARGRPGPVKV